MAKPVEHADDRDTADAVDAADNKVRYSASAGIAVITIDDAPNHNALSAAVRRGLWSAFRAFAADDTARVAILTGAGERAFCAGGDLKDMTQTGFARVPPDYLPLPGRNVHVDKPWIAAVNGYAIGGGVLYTMLADMAVASSRARFAMPEAKLSRGAPWSVPMWGQVPRKVWFELAVTGEQISAARAREVGLVNHVVEPAELLDKARWLAERVVRAAPLTVAATMKMMRAAANIGQVTAWDAADEYFEPVYQSEDGAEGPRAWVEKRPPVWKGR
jgi:enoyl-CoA hydratase/carnithine racemase